MIGHQTVLHYPSYNTVTNRCQTQHSTNHSEVKVWLPHSFLDIIETVTQFLQKCKNENIKQHCIEILEVSEAATAKYADVDKILDQHYYAVCT